MKFSPKQDIRVHEGDVVDLNGCFTIDRKDGTKLMRTTIRSESLNARIHIYGYGEAYTYKVARITKIREVVYYPKQYSSSRWYYMCDVYCDMENAEGETPDLISRNEFIPNKSVKKGVLPNFSFGGDTNGGKN